MSGSGYGAVAAENQRLATDALIYLFIVDTSPIGGADLYRWTPGPLSVSGSAAAVVFQGHTYTPIPVSMTGIAWNGRGPAPRPRVQVANIGGLLTSVVATYGDLVGAKVTRLTTYRKFLDGQPTADPSSYWEPDIWRIERKTVQSPQMIEWELGSVLDQEGRRLPGRQLLRDACTHTYRKWGGASFIYTNASCPYTGANYFRETGAPTGDPALDQCGKHLNDCRLRFPQGQNLPTRAFPGLDKYLT